MPSAGMPTDCSTITTIGERHASRADAAEDRQQHDERLLPESELDTRVAPERGR